MRWADMIGRDNRLAWRLADELATRLPDDDKTPVYVELGAGEALPALTRMLTGAVRNELSLPVGLITEIAACLDRYAGSIEEPLLRNLLMRAPGYPVDELAAPHEPPARDQRRRITRFRS